MGPKKPSDAAQRIAELGTEAAAAGPEEVAQVIFKVKGDAEHPDNIKNLSSGPVVKRGFLEKTYVYLVKKEVEDDEVARLNVEGLRVMILHQLNTLMPQQCKRCLVDHYLMVEETPKVSGCISATPALRWSARTWVWAGLRTNT